jgi:hypothetical protein
MVKTTNQFSKANELFAPSPWQFLGSPGLVLCNAIATHPAIAEGPIATPKTSSRCIH